MSAFINVPISASTMKMTTVAPNTSKTNSFPSSPMKNCVVQNNKMPIKNGIEYMMELASCTFRTKQVMMRSIIQTIDNGITIEEGKRVAINMPTTVNTHMKAKCFKTLFKFRLRLVIVNCIPLSFMKLFHIMYTNKCIKRCEIDSVLLLNLVVYCGR